MYLVRRYTVLIFIILCFARTVFYLVVMVERSEKQSLRYNNTTLLFYMPQNIIYEHKYNLKNSSKFSCEENNQVNALSVLFFSKLINHALIQSSNPPYRLKGSASGT